MGKPLAYLDHNILDQFVKNQRRDLEERIISEYQIVFADENLKEIHKSVGYESEFLDVLIRLNAIYIKNQLELPGFVDKGLIIIERVDPKTAYNEYLASILDFDGIQKAIMQWAFKFHGGRKGDPISTINNDLTLEFRKLLSELINKDFDLNLVSNLDSELIKKFENLIGDSLEVLLKEGENQILESGVNQENWNPIKDFRKEMKLSALQLNNITHPNVLLKIWDQYKSKPPYNDGFTLEKFFMLDKHPIYTDRDYLTHQKVSSAYDMLNTIGYYSDSQTYKEKKFDSFMSDSSHATMATFCDALFTGDERLARKAFAIYEYLEIGIRVEYIVL